MVCVSPVLVLGRHQQELGELQREKERVVEEGEAVRTQCMTLQTSLQQMRSSLAEKVMIVGRRGGECEGDCGSLPGWSTGASVGDRQTG